MSQTKPPNPNWASSGVVATPTATKISKGWIGGEKPGAGYFNWLVQNVYLWFVYLGNRIVGPWDTSDTPLNQYQDQAGNIRGLVDHNGYQLSRTTRFSEIWQSTASLTQYYATNVSGGTATVVPLTLIGGNAASLNASSVSSSCTLQTNLIAPVYANTSMVWEWEQYTVGAGSFGASFVSGFYVSSTINIKLITDASNSGHYYFTANNGSGAYLLQNTTLAAANNFSSSPDFIKWEFHGSNSPYGSCARVFINGNLFTLTLPSGMVGQVIGHQCQCSVTSSGASNTELVLSAVEGVWNRYLSPAAL